MISFENAPKTQLTQHSTKYTPFFIFVLVLKPNIFCMILHHIPNSVWFVCIFLYYKYDSFPKITIFLSSPKYLIYLTNKTVWYTNPPCPAQLLLSIYFSLYINCVYTLCRCFCCCYCFCIHIYIYCILFFFSFWGSWIFNQKIATSFNFSLRKQFLVAICFCCCSSLSTSKRGYSLSEALPNFNRFFFQFVVGNISFQNYFSRCCCCCCWTISMQCALPSGSSGHFTNELIINLQTKTFRVSFCRMRALYCNTPRD